MKKFTLCTLVIALISLAYAAPRGVLNSYNRDAWEKTDSNQFQSKNAAQMALLPVKISSQGDIKLTYTVKLLEANGDDSTFNAVHFGWQMLFPGNRKVQIYSWRNRLCYMETIGDKTVEHGTVGGVYAKTLEIGENAQERTFELLWRGDEVELMVGDDLFDIKKIGTERPTQLFFYFYNVRGEVKNIGFEKLDPAK